MRWNILIAAVIVTGLATTLVACGGLTRTSKSTSSAASSRAPKAANSSQAATKKSRDQLTDEDFRLRQIEEVKAPTWLPGVKHKAQDAFREGTKAALSSPPRYADASSKFEEAIELDPKFMEAYFNLGMIHERQGRREKALSIYQTALEENPDDVSASAYVAKIYLGKARSASLQGNEGEKDEWLANTKVLLDKLIAKAPTNEAVNNAMALYHLFLGDLETSEHFVKEVLYKEPTNITALNTRGLLNLQQGQYLIAEWIFLRKVLERDPNSTEALTNLGYTYIKLGQRPLAMRYFKKALVQDPSNMDVRMNIAAMLLEHLNYAEAYAHYTKVREAEPHNVEAHEGQCDAEYGMGGSATDKKAAFQRAVDCMLDYMRKRPDRTDLYMRIANTYQQQMQDLDGAVKYMTLYASKANLSPEEKTKIIGQVAVLKDIIAKGGLKAMMVPTDGDPFADEPAEGDAPPESDAGGEPAEGDAPPEGDASSTGDQE